MPDLAKWDSFYLIVGGAAGALIGLQFVVLTLIAERPTLRLEEAGAAFSTPNIVHFCTALLLSALLRVPWQTAYPAAILWGLLGFIGVIYGLVVVRRMRRQPVYRPGFEDWLFYTVLPLTGYAILVISAFTGPAHLDKALYAVGGAALLFLFLGIHNAWDSVSYHVFHQRAREAEHPEKEKK